MKNKIFAVFVVILVLILAWHWNAQKKHDADLETLKKAVMELDFQFYLLELKAKTLKKEVDMMRLQQAALDRQKKKRGKR